jgi:predicted ATPase
MHTGEEFGGLLAGLRRSLGLTQETLADRSGLSVRTIRNLEAGRIGRPRPASVSLLAGALELTGPQRTSFEMKARAADPVPRFADASAMGPPGHSPLPGSLVGREADLAFLLRLVPETRLVVLTGPGGVGKTRLAIAAANLMTSGYPDGVRIAQLGMLAAESGDPRRSNGAVSDAVLRSLGAAAAQSATPADVADWLGDRRMLLVIDNAEHVAGGTARLVEQLRLACPGLHMIVTSRRSLGVPGERLWEVLPLPVSPAKTENGSPGPAVELFVRRAVEQCRGLDLTDDLELVTTLCHCLDGLPVAIELAAGWLRSISVAELAERLSPGMLRMPGGSGLPHQQELATSLRWSLDLLTGQQQRLLTCLAGFNGTFDLAAVERLAGNHELADENLAAELAALVDNSLVQVTRGGRYRYRLLRPVRNYLAGTQAQSARLQADDRQVTGNLPADQLDRRHELPANCR